jgi:hypothetical protein
MQQDVPGVLLALHHRRGRLGIRHQGHFHAGARLEDVDESQAKKEGDRRGHFEVDDRLEPNPAHRLHVARAGDADDERRKQQRRDDHLDHAQEDVGERFDLFGEAGDVHAIDVRRGPEVADEDAEHEPDENLRGVGGAATLHRLALNGT